MGGSQTQIVPVEVGDAAQTMELSERLLERGVFAQGIRPPTVPEGSSRLRFTVMSTHREDELERAAKVAGAAARELGIVGLGTAPAAPSPPDALNGVFVTGTGTEVGKTVVAAAIARTLAAEGASVAVFKPAVTGLDEPAEADHALLRRASGSEQSDEEIAPYRYGPAASPHLAAALAGEEIDPARLVAAARAAAASADVLVCEGVGGLLVPLSRDYLVRDLAVELALPLVIAAPPGLGTINHTLLTIEAARGAGLEVAAVVLTPWPIEPSPIEQSNRETIQALGEVTVRDPAAPGPQRPAELAADGPQIRHIGVFEAHRPRYQTITSRVPGVSSTLKPASAAIAAAASGSAGDFFASSSARATSPLTAFAMWETALRLPPCSVKARTERSVACFGFQAAA